jgi:acetylornithine deacetylase/succinyl-diaminopimelate desuccinylase family protein
MTKTEKLLRELVALPSVNPAFMAPGDPCAGERNVAEFLGATAAQAGLEVSFQPVFRGRSNLFARLSAKGKMRQRILLAPHLDTVVAEESQFTPQKKDGRLFGRGTCDTKGSVAAMMTAMCELANSRQRPAETEIMFAGLIDEENAQAGSRALAAKGFHADLAIVGEPTRLEVVTAHKGSLWLRLETRGKSAHGARPELGRNAVHSMARVVDLLQTRYAAQLARKRHPLLGTPTVSVGVISGGTQANIVPDTCTILVDRRTLPGETEASVRRELRALLKANGLEAKCIDDKQAPCLPLETSPRNPLVRRFLQSVGQRQPAGVHYFCDAAVLAESGIPSIAFGPGDIAQAHTADEWISLDSLERARAMLLKFLRSLA